MINVLGLVTFVIYLLCYKINFCYYLIFMIIFF